MDAMVCPEKYGAAVRCGLSCNVLVDAIGKLGIRESALRRDRATLLRLRDVNPIVNEAAGTAIDFPTRA
ncbi:hypothetical protein [Sinorhizobium sojae]|uniref:hypothetical protein n=1 Tax=Sinorhizobium sojae TaxID=716925 RepID=UPI0012F8ECB8|nr:hypothetical protein [Sinorhizobium sojae]